MAVPPQATPLLLTKRLNAFLRAHATPQLPTLLLTTHHGKLLAHASLSTGAGAAQPPVAVLRTHATVAASLLAIHTASSAALPGALDSSTSPPGEDDDGESSSSLPEDDDDDDDETARGTDDDEVEAGRRRHTHAASTTTTTTMGTAVKPVTITVQLSGGTVIIRRLRCGLLLVCVGPSPSAHDGAAAATAASASSSSAPLPGSSAGVAELTQALESADLVSAETESLTSVGGQASATSGDSAAAAGAAAAATAPSASGSSTSSGSSSSVVAMRRHAAELARWLDEKLGTLTVPEDRTGAE
ncbi:hypothetical protein ISF_02272 [Cordyceps fumosorosea ARSEF 2679]|uniref:Uncharacterized protein n=1 Tax=Cordyceps fumosorosea (strain ARSEF 2679) TaxID=1081104 RepID=A0A168BM51_CORFA|nr:hypothetical protein ISF_02272 [Cordyceps fumosorosea ARSEF 2679]OAA70298.1 hypothetical protein ISF_02272 [Cordyceps fumosorosea ARSEF 2679]